MDKKTSKCFIDTNFIIDACAAGIAAEFRAYAEMRGLDVIVPSEVYKEAIGDEMTEFLGKMSLDKSEAVAEFPPLPENKRADNAGKKIKRGLGEDHAIAMARWFEARGERVLVITSDKKAQKRLDLLKIANVSVHDVILELNHDGILPKEQALLAIARLEQSRNVTRADEKEAFVRQLR